MGHYLWLLTDQTLIVVVVTTVPSKGTESSLLRLLTKTKILTIKNFSPSWKIRSRRQHLPSDGAEDLISDEVPSEVEFSLNSI